MAGKRIITVFGATGGQGGSVAQIFLNDPKLSNAWTVRAVTRDVARDNAKKLQSQGAEVVAADLNDKSTLVKAMTGAAAVFAVTNYWEKMDHELEYKQGQSLVDAAKETGVGHFVWSSLYDVNKLSKGKLPHVYHFDSKAKVEEYARSAGIPATFFMPGFYMSNIPGGMFRPAPDSGAWTFTLPVPASAPIPLFDATGDTGKFVKAIILKGEAVHGKRVLAATRYQTGQEIVDAFKASFPEAGKNAAFYQLPEATYKGILMEHMKLPDFAAQEMLENMLLLDQFGYYGGAKLDESHAILEDKLTTWDEFMKKAPAFKDLK